MSSVDASDDSFKHLGHLCEADPRSWVPVDANFVWHVREGDTASRWLLQFRGNPEVRRLSSSEPAPSDCQLASSASVAEAIFSGELSPQRAFLAGEIELAGNLRAALRFNVLIEQFCKTTPAPIY